MYLREKYRRPEDAHPRTANATSGYRSFSPHIGTWCSRDPAGERRGINLLLFVLNLPVGRWDYLGRHSKGHPEACCDCKRTLGKGGLLDKEPFKSKVADLIARKCILKAPFCQEKGCEYCGLYKRIPYPYEWSSTTVGLILVCTKKNIARCCPIEATLRHEMQHADNKCNKAVCGEENPTTLKCCALQMCHEMRGYFCESKKNQSLSWDDLAELAWNSVKHHPCKDYNDRTKTKNKAKQICPDLPKAADCYVQFPQTPAP